MREFRKKQRKLKKIMNILVTFAAIYFFIYIGLEPTLAAWSNTATLVVGYIADILVLVVLSVLFVYFSKYGKTDLELEYVEYELDDCGYYLTSRNDNDLESYFNSVVNDLKSNGYSINKNVEINDFEFDATCYKRKEMFYIVNINDLDKNDILAYMDSAIYDVTAVNIKRKGNGVVLFICDKADDGAISLSKMITPLNKKGQLKLSIAIAEVSTNRVYFLGNKVTKCQQMIANYVMNCDLPIKDCYKSNEKLQFQADLEEHLKSFNIKEYKNGTYFIH